MPHFNGDIANHVMWRGNPVPADAAWALFIEWVAAYKAIHPRSRSVRR
jgi:hypothetical protein